MKKYFFVTVCLVLNLYNSTEIAASMLHRHRRSESHLDRAKLTSAVVAKPVLDDSLREFNSYPIRELSAKNLLSRRNISEVLNKMFEAQRQNQILIEHSEIAQKLLFFCAQQAIKSSDISRRDILSLILFLLSNKEIYYGSFDELIEDEGDSRENYIGSFYKRLSEKVYAQSMRFEKLFVDRNLDRKNSIATKTRIQALTSSQMRTIVDNFITFYLHIIGVIQKYEIVAPRNVIEQVLQTKTASWRDCPRDKIPTFAGDSRLTTSAHNIYLDTLKIRQNLGQNLVNILNVCAILIEEGYYELCEEIISHINPLQKLKMLRNGDCISWINDAYILYFANTALESICETLRIAQETYPNGSFMSSIKLDSSSLHIDPLELAASKNAETTILLRQKRRSSTSRERERSISPSITVVGDSDVVQNEIFIPARMNLNILMRAPELCSLAWNSNPSWSDNELLKNARFYHGKTLVPPKLPPEIQLIPETPFSLKYQLNLGITLMKLKRLDIALIQRGYLFVPPRLYK